jgi:hypothetical protein
MPGLLAREEHVESGLAYILVCFYMCMYNVCLIYSNINTQRRIEESYLVASNFL